MVIPINNSTFAKTRKMKQQEIIKLKVGDVIYGENRIYGIREMFTIKRVTKTLAISDNVRCRLETENGRVRMVGEEIGFFNRTLYYIETDELKEKFERQSLITKLQTFDYKKLPTETLRELENIIK